jgi:hypothetical protein
MSADLLRVVRLDALDVLCVDFKGECMLGNRKCCYPLTITDYCSR